MEVKFFYGAAEVPAHIRLLNDQSIAPGQTAWVQFALREELAVIKGDRFIVRLPSPSITLGGGTVIDPQPGRRHRRFRSDVIARLETLAQGSPAELLLQLLETSGPLAISELLKRSSLPAGAARSALDELIESQRALLLSENSVIASATWQTLKNKISAELIAYHRSNPLKAGLPREELKSKLGLDAKIFNLIIERATTEGILGSTGSVVRKVNFQIQFNAQQKKSTEALLNQFKASPWNTPSIKDSESSVGADVLSALIDQGQLIKLSDEVLLSADTYRSAVEKIKAHLIAKKTITVAQVRDLFSTSRKYALALMEYLDTQEITKRKGDERVAGHKF
jgi:selenocysteine-specific elongation factor